VTTRPARMCFSQRTKLSCGATIDAPSFSVERCVERRQVLPSGLNAKPKQRSVCAFREYVDRAKATAVAEARFGSDEVHVQLEVSVEPDSRREQLR
jgi:hypothetical protein